MERTEEAVELVSQGSEPFETTEATEATGVESSINNNKRRKQAKTEFQTDHYSSFEPEEEEKPLSYGKTRTGPEKEVFKYNWLLSILALVFFLPFGIASMMYAMRAKKSFKQGKIIRARDEIENAKIWFKAAIFMGLFLVVFVVGSWIVVHIKMATRD